MIQRKIYGLCFHYKDINKSTLFSASAAPCKLTMIIFLCLVDRMRRRIIRLQWNWLKWDRKCIERRDKIKLIWRNLLTFRMESRSFRMAALSASLKYTIKWVLTILMSRASIAINGRYFDQNKNLNFGSRSIV